MNFHFLVMEDDKYVVYKQTQEGLVRLYKGKKLEIAYQRVLNSLGISRDTYSVKWRNK